MELFEKLSPNFRHIDERGELVQLVQDGFIQMNVLKTHKGVCRGGHYHSHVKEAFYVIEGCVEVTLSLNIVANSMRNQQPLKLNENKHLFYKGDFFLIPPGVLHSLFFPEDCIMVALYDKCVIGKDGEKDIHFE